jgi:hypothetical protein
MLLQQQSNLAKYLFQCRLFRSLIGESRELARLINASVNALRLKSRSPEHDWKVLRGLPRQDLSLGVVNRYIPGNPKREVVKCTRVGPGGVEFDHLAVQKQVQGMFLCFNFSLRVAPHRREQLVWLPRLSILVRLPYSGSPSNPKPTPNTNTLTVFSMT